MEMHFCPDMGRKQLGDAAYFIECIDQSLNVS
jgi:hypothetical protein